jgi:hypothetical protein
VAHPGIRDPTQQILALTAAYSEGVSRLFSARIVSNTMLIALIDHHVLSRDKGYVHSPGVDFLRDELQKISFVELKAFEYISNASHVVYATTLLDTYLSDVYRLLLLLFPKALGREYKVDLYDVISASTRNSLISDIVIKKVREIGFGSLMDRIDGLTDRFGLKFSLTTETRSDIVFASELRNRIVHDQGMLQSRLGDDGIATITLRDSGSEPTVVTRDHFARTVRAYGGVVGAILTSVTLQVCKQELSPSGRHS